MIGNDMGNGNLCLNFKLGYCHKISLEFLAFLIIKRLIGFDSNKEAIKEEGP